MSSFKIPASATGLREVSHSQLDLRPDSEILAELSTFQPITTEKNVWAFWDKGIDTMYPNYQHTVLNWVHKLGPSWTVRVVDLIEDSPNNVYKYLDKKWFPDCFVNKTMDGKHAPQHASDLVRLPLLYEYGGVWMDVGNMLHTHLDTLFWDALTAPNTPYEMGAWIISGMIRKPWGSFANFMLAARKHCSFIKYWHDSYASLWEGRTNVDGFHKLPAIQQIGLAEGMADWEFQDKIAEMSDYVAHMLIADRTRNLLDEKTGWNGRDFWEKKVFMVEGIFNGILGGIKSGYNGFKEVEWFTTELDEKHEEKRKAAEEFVVEMLEKSHMYKVYHNPAGGPPALADVIKKDGYRDAVERKGTFGELYRYGTVFWESKREVKRLEPQATGEELIRV